MDEASKVFNNPDYYHKIDTIEGDIRDLFPTHDFGDADIPMSKAKITVERDHNGKIIAFRIAPNVNISVGNGINAYPYSDKLKILKEEKND